MQKQNAPNLCVPCHILGKSCECVYMKVCKRRGTSAPPLVCEVNGEQKIREKSFKVSTETPSECAPYRVRMCAVRAC